MEQNDEKLFSFRIFGRLYGLPIVQSYGRLDFSF